VWLVGLSAGEQMDSYRAIDGDHRGACCPVAWWGLPRWGDRVDVCHLRYVGRGGDGRECGRCGRAGGGRRQADRDPGERDEVQGEGDEPSPAGRGHVDGEAAER
jgi:hypothetical protein